MAPNPSCYAMTGLATDGIRASGRQHPIQHRHTDGSLSLLGFEARPDLLLAARCSRSGAQSIGTLGAGLGHRFDRIADADKRLDPSPMSGQSRIADTALHPDAVRRILSHRIGMAGIVVENFNRLRAQALRVGFIIEVREPNETVLRGHLRQLTIFAALVIALPDWVGYIGIAFAQQIGLSQLECPRYL
jgi:hypothetical protein